MSTRTAIRATGVRAAGCHDTPNSEGVGLLVVVPKPLPTNVGSPPRAISAVSRRRRARCPPKRTLQRYVATSPNHLPCTRSHNSGGVPHDLEGTHPEGKQRSTFYVRTFSAQPPTYSSVNVPSRCCLMVVQATAVVKSGLKPTGAERLSQGRGSWACAPEGKHLSTTASRTRRDVTRCTPCGRAASSATARRST